jgi:rare lipoprotein A
MKSAILLLAILALLTGCAHKPVTVAVPTTPPAETPTAPSTTESVPIPAPNTAEESLEQQVPSGTKPLLTQVGIASWYGAPYHNRAGSNGEIYNMHAMTAAHRTLPLGSIVRVTDLHTRASTLVRITDRGPFIEGRIIDLSQAAAKRIGMLQAGTTEVRVELLKTPVPLDGSGRWAVQIGAFEREQAARHLAEHLSRRYHSARVLTFNSPVGDWWVRVRVKDDLRARAEQVIHETRTSEGAVFLVRLD